MSRAEEAPPRGHAWRQDRKAFARFPDSPLASLSSSLTSARRSADNLLHVAAEAERKLKAEGERIRAEFERQAKTTSTKLRASLQHLQPPIGEEWGNAMAGNPYAGKRRDRSRSKMRRVRSASDFRRGSRMLAGSSGDDEGKEWDLFAALNNTLSASRSPIAGSPYQAPSTFQDQVCLLSRACQMSRARMSALSVLDLPRPSACNVFDVNGTYGFEGKKQASCVPFWLSFRLLPSAP